MDADVVVSDPFLFVCKQKVLDFDKDYKVINWKKTKLIYFENELDLSDPFWVFLMRFLDLDVNWEFTTRKIKFHSIYILGDVHIIRHVSRGINKFWLCDMGGGGGSEENIFQYEE